jgi:hypothetical protein
MFAPLMEALLHCKPILSFDACALKGTYKGILMAATMMDGAGQILPLACYNMSMWRDKTDRDALHPHGGR